MRVFCRKNLNILFVIVSLVTCLTQEGYCYSSRALKRKRGQIQKLKEQKLKSKETEAKVNEEQQLQSKVHVVSDEEQEGTNTINNVDNTKDILDGIANNIANLSRRMIVIEENINSFTGNNSDKGTKKLQSRTLTTKSKLENNQEYNMFTTLKNNQKDNNDINDNNSYIGQESLNYYSVLPITNKRMTISENTTDKTTIYYVINNVTNVNYYNNQTQKDINYHLLENIVKLTNDMEEIKKMNEFLKNVTRTYEKKSILLEEKNKLLEKQNKAYNKQINSNCFGFNSHTIFKTTIYVIVGGIIIKYGMMLEEILSIMRSVDGKLDNIALENKNFLTKDLMLEIANPLLGVFSSILNKLKK